MQNPNETKKAAKDWEPYFRKAQVRVEELDANKSSKSKTVKIGRFLSPKVSSGVSIEVGGRTGRAVLRVEEGRAKEKKYYFEVIWDEPEVVVSGSDTEQLESAKEATTVVKDENMKPPAKQKKQNPKPGTPITATTKKDGNKKAGNKKAGNKKAGNKKAGDKKAGDKKARTAVSSQGNDEDW